MPKVYVAGHMGMVGSAIVRRLSKENGLEILTRSRKELDLFNQRSVIDFLKSERPDYVFIAAAKVGGILANDQQRADFIYQNLLLETNLIGGAFEAGIKDFVFSVPAAFIHGYVRNRSKRISFDGSVGKN